MGDPLSPGGATAPPPSARDLFASSKKITLRSCRPLLGRQNPCRPWGGRPGAIFEIFQNEHIFFIFYFLNIKKEKTPAFIAAAAAFIAAHGKAGRRRRPARGAAARRQRRAQYLWSVDGRRGVACMEQHASWTSCGARWEILWTVLLRSMRTFRKFQI